MPEVRRSVSREDAKSRQDAKVNGAYVACIKGAFGVCYLSAITPEVEPCFEPPDFCS
jgi:hypothetical protein